MITIEPTDYKAAQITGKQRVFGGTFSNELGGIPSIVFNEELITLDGTTGAVYRNQTGSCAASLTDPAKPLALRNPLDDSVVGTATYMDVMVMIYSLGRQTQIERDQALLSSPSEVV